VAGAAAAGPLHGGSAAGAQTNIVFILTDDHGAWAMNCYGCGDLHTPNLDRLAADGARFTNAYACTPVCSPSRMTYFTGRLPSHHGVQDWLLSDELRVPNPVRYLDGQPTFSEVLARNGYTVGLCGKWHMGGDERAQAGFSSWSSVPGGGGTYRDAVFVRNGIPVQTRGFKDDFVGDYSLEFIERNRNRPFCLYTAFYSPHIPYDFQTEEDRKWYRESQFRCLPDEPLHPWATNGCKNQLADPNRKIGYYSLVTAMDRNVGRILGRLDDLGLRDKTVVVFTADQGHCSGHHGLWGKGNASLPLNLYEESLHIPLIWNQPGRIRPGQVLDPMVSSYDFFPTLLDYAGVPAPRDRRRVGRSYAAFLRGQAPPWRNELYFEYEYVRGIRTRNLKYIERAEGWPSELFDLEADAGERRDVIADARHGRQLAALRSRLAGFFSRAGAPPLAAWRSTTRQTLPQYGRPR
jgi:arylsulfatase A-like enzyme